jgi:hypothetical protein
MSLLRISLLQAHFRKVVVQHEVRKHNVAFWRYLNPNVIQFLKGVKKEAAEGHIRLQDISHTYPTGSDSQTRSRHIYGDIQLPIDLMNSSDTRLKSLISCVSPELRDADVINADSSSEANSKAQSSNDLV